MCKDTNECPVLNSICTSKICSCPIGYLPGQTVNECLKGNFYQISIASFR